VPKKAQRVKKQLAQKVMKRVQKAVKTLAVSRKEKQPVPKKMLRVRKANLQALKKLLVLRKEMLKESLVLKRAVLLMKFLVLKKATPPVKRKELRASKAKKQPVMKRKEV
jgi:hypothetical protein